jgi:predicted TIM-barrel fold metal-dependent hydrolase
MQIDAFTHFLPGEYATRLSSLGETPAATNIRRRVAGIPAIADLDLRLRQLEEFGPDYRQILSLPAPPLENLGDPALAAELARIANDGLAELVREHPDHFAGFVAALPLNDMDASLEEIDRAIDDLGALGVQIYTSVAGVPWDAPDLRPFWAKMAERDRMVWAHPGRNQSFPDYVGEATSKYEIWWTFGWPYDTSAFMARIVFDGVFDRHPGLKILTHHGGGMVPHFAGRVGSGWDQLGARTPDEQRADVETSITRRPVDYFKMFYVDTAMMGAPHSLTCVLEFFGAEHVLFASDSPFDPEKGPGYIRSTLADLETIELSPTDRQLILAGNAQRLLHLPVSAQEA